MEEAPGFLGEKRMTGWWFGTFFSYYMGCHPSHWRTPSFFKMVKTCENHQPEHIPFFDISHDIIPLYPKIREKCRIYILYQHIIYSHAYIYIYTVHMSIYNIQYIYIYIIIYLKCIHLQICSLAISRMDVEKRQLPGSSNATCAGLVICSLILESFAIGISTRSQSNCFLGYLRFLRLAMSL